MQDRIDRDVLRIDRPEPSFIGRDESADLAPRSRSGRAVKRAMDLIVSCVLLVVLMPCLLLLGLIIRLSSPGPVLFRQTRVGRSGSPFVIFKFRTMYQDNDDRIHREVVTAMLDHRGDPSDPGPQKLKDDPRITGIGRVLRRTSLDELPQLLNIVAGHMSLVGPRPPLPWEMAMFPAESLVRFRAKPGLTGLWQVSGRGELSMARALDLDVDYVRRASLRLDLVILLRTVPVVLTGRGAR